MAPKQKVDTRGEEKVKKERNPRKETEKEELLIHSGYPSLISKSGVEMNTNIGSYDAEDVL